MSHVSRRQFLSTSALSRARRTLATHGWAADKPLSANDKINIASIGVGGQGKAITGSAVKSHNLVAMCDVDEKRRWRALGKANQAAKFADFRKMFDKLDKQIDAVAISTPGSHALSSGVCRTDRGKHVYWKSRWRTTSGKCAH